MDQEWYVYGVIAVTCLMIYFIELVLQYKVLINADREFDFTYLNVALAFVGITSLLKALTILG